jgi:UDPglucose--hexose-1-phosphate uridylyltransferase
MNIQELASRPHRRLNPLTGEWVLVSPHRNERPWLGQVEPVPLESQLPYDPNCYLCPGNARAEGVRNPKYKDIFAFDNDYAALKPGNAHVRLDKSGLLVAQSESGRCRVLCFSPRHDLTIARMPVADIGRVVHAWVEEFRQLGDEPNIRAVQIFENRGVIMGCSNPHPHGQIWSNESVPNELAKEVRSFREYYRKQAKTLLTDYLALEGEHRDRVVCGNEHFVVVVPFWAVWPFETLLISRRAVSSLLDLRDEERAALAEILQQITIRYDNLFNTSFPYSMGFHQRPTDGKEYPEFHMHAHFYPPLLRSPTVKKFMVGYEMLAMPQRDLTPERAAAWLREVPARHYRCAEP